MGIIQNNGGNLVAAPGNRPVRAGAIGGGGGGGGGGSPYLDGVIASVCCDLDATIAASYPGTGQTWANLIASPADGAGQTDYDFWLGTGSGASTDDPTFTGSAGDAAAYFAMDGGDFFMGKSTTAPLTFFNIHKKTGGTNAWWIAWAGNFGADSAQSPWGRGNTGNTYGFYLYKTGASGALYQDRTTSITGLGGFMPNTDPGIDYIILVSVDVEATTNNAKIWVNTTTGSTFSQSWFTVSTDPSYPFAIGASTSNTGGTNYRLTNGSRVYHFSAGNELLDDTKAAAIFAHLEARHSRDYTP